MDAKGLGDTFGLAGSHVLITGAGGGIGRALVAAFRAAGAVVTGADRDEDLLRDLALDHRLGFDLTDNERVRKGIADLITDAGCPDILVNNAGLTRGDTLDQVDQEVWNAELAINLTGAFSITDPVLSGMIRRGSGSIVFVASVNGLSHFGNAAYSAAKAGLIAFAKAIAVERGRFGIRANVVCPGSVPTAWDHRFARDPELLGKILPHYPLGRLVIPEEVARTVLFLSSPLASGITGVVVPVDAGLTAGNHAFVTQVIEAG